MKLWLLLVCVVCTSATPGQFDPFNVIFDPLNEGFTQELYGHSPVTSNIYVGIGFDGFGQLITVNCDGNTAQVFSKSTVIEHGTVVHPNSVVTLAPSLGTVAACSLVNGADGYLYLGTYSNGIVKLDPFTYDAIPLGIPSSGPVRLGIAIDPQNTDNIYYVEYLPGAEIRYWNKVTGVDTHFATADGCLDAINWDPSGDTLYGAVFCNNAVAAFNRDGTLRTTWSSGGVPDGIAVQESTLIVFTNNNDGTLRRDAATDPNGASASIFASGGYRGDHTVIGGDSCWYLTQDGARFLDGTEIPPPWNSVVKICGGGGFAKPPGTAITTGTTQDPTTGTTGATCEPVGGTYTTQSEGDWGDLCSQGFETGCYRDAEFATCFPDGLTVGCPCNNPVRTAVAGYGGGGHSGGSSNSNCKLSMHFDSSVDISNYLPQLGSPAVLDKSYENPSQPPPISTGSGNFGGQVTALALSIGFSDCDPNFHTACGKLENLFICDNRCESCKKNNNNCRRNSEVDCQFVSARYEDTEEEFINKKNNGDNNGGKPQYANCEAFYGKTIGQIFSQANSVLGGCSNCTSLEKKNNQNCVRNSSCRKNPVRNSCSRNNSCKKNSNCCCCVDQSADPSCDPVVLNDCVTLINQGFIFGKTLSSVDSGNLFSETPCP